MSRWAKTTPEIKHVIDRHSELVKATFGPPISMSVKVTLKTGQVIQGRWASGDFAQEIDPPMQKAVIEIVDEHDHSHFINLLDATNISQIG